MEHRITKYPLEQGALEIEYIEEFFGEYQAPEDRRGDRRPPAEPRSPHFDGDGAAARRSRAPSSRCPTKWRTKSGPRSDIPKLADLVERLRDYVDFNGRRILYTWIGGTRRDWRGQGHFRALTEQQEAWAIENGFDEILVKTKNRFYEMRGTLDHLHFDVVKYEPHPDNHESKVYLSKKLGQAGARRASEHADGGDGGGLGSRTLGSRLGL